MSERDGWLAREGAPGITARRMTALGLWDAPATAPEDVVERLVAMQAQEYHYAWWSVGQRMNGSPGRSTVARAFDEGRFLRTHVLRPTWHLVAAVDLRWLIELSGPRVMVRNARRYAELDLDPRTLEHGNVVIADAVAGGPMTRRDVADSLERRGISADGQRLAYLLMHAELNAVVCSGPMTGKQHTYAAFDERVPAGEGRSGDEALTLLARRYFMTRGPATVRDFAWWSGLNAADARDALEGSRADLESCVVDGRTYWLAGDARVTRDPQIDLVQAFDETIISYTESRDLLRSDVDFPVPAYVDGYSHVILANGRLLGHWRPVRSRTGTALDVRLGRELDPAERLLLDEAIERYRWFTDG